MKKITLLLSALLISMLSFATVITFDADVDLGDASKDSNSAAAYTISKDGVYVLHHAVVHGDDGEGGAARTAGYGLRLGRGDQYHFVHAVGAGISKEQGHVVRLYGIVEFH